MTRRRWIADTWTETSASLTGDQALHLARVLRAEPGQIFDVVANGFLHRAEVTRVSESEVVFTLHEELEAEATLPVHLLLAVFKFDHLEWGIEKCTELGAARITPVLARRTDRHLAQAALKRAERWRRITLEASKQSRRSDLPTLDDPQPLKSALALVSAPRKLLLAETEQDHTLAAALKAGQRVGRSEGQRVSRLASQQVSGLASQQVSEPTSQQVSGLASQQVSESEGQPVGESPKPSVALAIGPEGGWTPEEMAMFSADRWQHVTLGPRILRAETAAIAGLAICSALL